MNPIIVSVNEWLYPDVFHYASQSDSIRLRAPRGGYAAVQVLIPDTKAGERISVSCGGTLSAPECYRLIDVRVQYNTGMTLSDVKAGRVIDASAYTTRQAPYRVYDALEPFDQGGEMTDKKNTALYLCWKIAPDAASGELFGDVTVTIGGESAVIPASIVVHKAVLPARGRMQTANWLYTGVIEKRYGVKPLSENWFRIYGKFMDLLNRTRQTHMLISLGLIKIDEKDGKYTFDFTDIRRVIAETLSHGLTTPELGHLTGKDYNTNEDYFLFYAPEGRRIPADSDEGYNFLAQFLPRWTEFLKENGWYDISVQHVGDEPIAKQAANYRTICGIVRKFMPGMKLFDAISATNLLGSVDCWIPLNSHYQEHRELFEHLRDLGDDIWQYTCCGPGGKWLNRMIDFELLRPRLLHYGNYLYNLSGYLHWGFAAWQKDQPDPIEYTNAVINDGVALLPPGDTHVCYPGNENGPWMSIRAEAMRSGIEDCELLWAIGAKDKEKADALCKKVMRAFDDYTTAVRQFEDNYQAILETADELA